MRRSLVLFDAFISRTLHLVRTPCQVIQDGLEEVLASRADQETVNECLNLVHEVVSMTSDVSDVMRFEQGALFRTVPLPDFDRAE